jgi:hypothetical protein
MTKQKDGDGLEGREEDPELGVCMSHATIHEKRGRTGVAFLFAPWATDWIRMSETHGAVFLIGESDFVSLESPTRLCGLRGR